MLQTAMTHPTELNQRSRLPIQHPDYRYPVSPNPYWLKLSEIKGHVFLDNDTEAHRGHWRELFPRKSPPESTAGPELHVEIGCNGGHVILEWAARNPAHRYIGLDWKFKQIYRAFEKAAKRDLRNIIFFRAHAERIRYMFGPEEIDNLYLFFPDPWPRKSQWKNRFVNEANLKALHGIIRRGGFFHIRTDHQGYFEWMEDAVARTADLWEISERSMDLHRGHPDPKSLTIPEVTLFERLFIKDGIPIKMLKLRRI